MGSENQSKGSGPFARAIVSCLLLLSGFALSAQSAGAYTEEKILIDDGWFAPPTVLYAKDNEIFSDGRKKLKTNRFFGRYVFEGRDYRKLSASEAAQFDAMPKVKTSFWRARLYFDGRKISANAKGVYSIKAAHYWNGGVALVGYTSMNYTALPWYVRFFNESAEFGFIDLGTGNCKFGFVGFGWGTPKLDILVPVTLDLASSDLALDVAMPELVYTHEVLDIPFSLTNRSGKSIVLPNSISEGLGFGVADEKSTLTMAEYATKLDQSYGSRRPEKSPEHPDASQTVHSPLAPGEKRDAALPFEVGKILKPGHRRVIFWWDGFLDPNNRDTLSRFFCEKWVEVAEPTIDTSNKDLILEVAAPKYAVDNGKFDIAFALTNVSDRTILVPDALEEGLGLALTYKCHWFSGRETIEQKSVKLPALRVPYGGTCSPLGPKERRMVKIKLDGDKLFGYTGTRECHIRFYWDWPLDPDAKGTVARFEAGAMWLPVRGRERTGTIAPGPPSRWGNAITAERGEPHTRTTP